MTCREAADLIGPYVDDDLPEATRRNLQRHLLNCQSCAYDAETLRITREYLRGQAGEVVASDAFRARTLARLHKDNEHLSAEPAPAEAEPAQYRLPIKV